jgi:hypothetical protein
VRCGGQPVGERRVVAASSVEPVPVYCRKQYVGARRTEHRREAGPIGDEEVMSSRTVLLVVLRFGC